MEEAKAEVEQAKGDDTKRDNLLLNERSQPPNPVLCALQLASACRDEMARYGRDKGVSDQLLHASRLLEHVASGLLNGAVRAAAERHEITKSFNPWVTGTQPVEPSVARDFFTSTSLHHAAENDLKVYVSNPFVYSHLQQLFMPAAPAVSRGSKLGGGGGGGAAGTMASTMSLLDAKHRKTGSNRQLLQLAQAGAGGGGEGGGWMSAYNAAVGSESVIFGSHMPLLVRALGALLRLIPDVRMAFHQTPRACPRLRFLLPGCLLAPSPSD